MDDFEKKLLEQLTSNAERVEKPVPVEIAGLPKMFVRPILVADVSAADEDGGEGSFQGRRLAKMLCKESGERFSSEVQSAFSVILDRQPESVLIALAKAAGLGGDSGN